MADLREIVAGWLQSAGITGLAAQPPENLARHLEELIPVKIPALRRMAGAALARRFGANAQDFGSEIWRYEGQLEGTPLKVTIRYSGRMARPQMAYEVEVAHRAWPLTGVRFESILGAGFGMWNYLTRENAERSVALLCDLVGYVAELPERLPKGELQVERL